MTHAELVKYAEKAGAADAQVFALAVGCARHGQEAMDLDEDNLEAFCHVCEGAMSVHDGTKECRSPERCQHCVLGLSPELCEH